jgi:hypothetical protein
MALMVLCGLAVSLLSILLANWLGVIVGGAFLISTIGSLIWKHSGPKYAIGTGLIVLSWSIVFLATNYEATSIYGLAGVIVTSLFTVGAFFTYRDQNK